MLIDTAKRQEVKEKKKDLTELARDMVMAPDGKTLLVVEELRVKGKGSGSGVVFFSIDTWQSERLDATSVTAHGSFIQGARWPTVARSCRFFRWTTNRAVMVRVVMARGVSAPAVMVRVALALAG